MAKQQIQSGEVVPVRLTPEPNNPYDANAVVFECKIEGCWYRIGYAVREALEEIHLAMRQNLIKTIAFSWVRFVVKWTATGAGYYAGIAITKRGQWSQIVCRCASTISH